MTSQQALTLSRNRHLAYSYIRQPLSTGHAQCALCSRPCDRIAEWDLGLMSIGLRTRRMHNALFWPVGPLVITPQPSDRDR